MRRKNRKKKIVIRANTMQKKDKVSGKRNHSSKKKVEKLCIRCGINPIWLEYPLCYNCYLKKIEENKEKTNHHWRGGTGETLF